MIGDLDFEAGEHDDGSAAEHRDRKSPQPENIQKTSRKHPEDIQKTSRRRVGPDKGGHWRVLDESATWAGHTDRASHDDYA